jgi:catechol 2,3-dioxygenase-like lactoylglutathione lyase family enzyme
LHTARGRPDRDDRRNPLSAGCDHADRSCEESKVGQYPATTSAPPAARAGRAEPSLLRRGDEETAADLEAEPARLSIFDGIQSEDNLFRAMKLEGIDHVAIAVPDMDRAIAWYTEVLGFQRQHTEEWNGVPAFLGLGSTAIALFPQEQTSAAQPVRGGPMLHLAFRTDRPGFVRAQEELRWRKISFRFEDHEIAHSIYFRDLNGLPLEITTYDVVRKNEEESG